MTKEILCFGDSNTWGFNPIDATRYTREARWPGVAQAALGEGWRMIEEGLNGRTTVFEDEIEPGRRGFSSIIMLLETHMPLDLVILMLGTNDTKTRYGATVRDISLGWLKLAKAIRERCLWFPYPPPKILLAVPPPVLDCPNLTESFEGAPEKSAHFAEVGRQIAEANDLLFFDCGTVIQSSPVDGIHLSPESHKALGLAMAGFLRRSMAG
ncbi:MAG: arylesterase protein [Spirochaetes bacterium]|nr:MAG: arylesterase protein [Spirochaetota bacterium]